MTLTEIMIFLKHVQEEHSFCRSKNRGERSVKYVSFTYDTRTATAFAVKVDGVDLVKVNENRKRNLLSWAHAYLDGKEDGFDFKRDDPELYNILNPPTSAKEPTNG